MKRIFLIGSSVFLMMLVRYSYAVNMEKSVAFFHRQFFFSDHLCSVGEANAVCGDSDTGGPLTLWEEDNR